MFVTFVTHSYSESYRNIFNTTVSGDDTKDAGVLKMQDQKMQDLKMREQMSGVENTGPENAGTPMNTENLLS